MSEFSDLVRRVRQQEPFLLPVRLLLDSAAHFELQRLEQRLEAALSRPDDDDVTAIGPVELAGQIAALLDSHEPAEFVFRAVSGMRWDDLVAEHPSEDGRDVRSSFWPVIMAECCVEPEGATVELFAELVGDGETAGSLNSGQRETLMQAVREVNRGLTDLRPSFAATALIRGTRPNSTTAPPGASPAPGSSGDVTDLTG